MDISVLFPAYNEERNLEAVVTSALTLLPAIAESYEIIIVNDGSRDKTGTVAAGLAGRSPHVRVIHHETNLGYGAALRSGIERARKDLIFFCDSDGQFTLEDLPRLLEWIDRYDVVIGYRTDRQDPFHRRLNAFGWKILVRWLLGLQVRDIDCAFKLFHRAVFDQIEMRTAGAMINTEILVRALKRGCTIKEVPVRHFPRFYGRPSGASPRVIMKAFYELLKMYGALRGGKSRN